MIAPLAERARRLHDERGGRVVVGIVGAPGAGKSLVAEALVRELGPMASLIEMDGFHLDNTVLTELGRRDRKGAPDTFDVEGYLGVLRTVRRGDVDVVVPVFDRESDFARAAARVIPADAPIVITEGNYLLLDAPGWNQVRGLLDEAWWIHTDPSTRTDRLIARHVRYGRKSDEAREWVLRSDEANARAVSGDRTKADLVINNTTAI